MEKDARAVLDGIKDSSSAYLRLNLELLKLNVYEKTAIVVSVLSYGLVALFAGVLAVLFVSLAAGFLLSSLTGSYTLGFLLVGIVCSVFFTLVAVFRTKIKDAVMNQIVSVLRQKEAEMKNDGENE